MKAIGIDLGTTNSVAAHCEPGQDRATILENSQSERWTPSVVSVKDEELVIGRRAVHNAGGAPEETIVSVKRLMGRDLEDAEIVKVRERVSYELVPGPGDDPRVHVRFQGKARTPVEISAMILGKLREDATRKLGEEVTHAVITVPAYFKVGQRVATRDAGEQAGLVVKRILDEPTAAAIAFGVEVSEPSRHRILVFDLGGGTFDVSILQMVPSKSGKPHFVVLHYEGDNWLGGDDFDYAIVDRISDWIKGQYGEDPSGGLRFRLLAKQQAEAAKRELSELTKAKINIPAAAKAKGVTVDVDLTVTRADFQDMIDGMVTRAIELASEALRKQQLTPGDISDVLLVGGATMTPLVQERVEGLFGKANIRRSVNAMECVALGAAIFAANADGVECPNPDCRTVSDETATTCSRCGMGLASARTAGGVKVHDITGMSLGIKAVKGADPDVFVPIIPRGTPYPLSKARKQTFRATGRRIKVPVYQGNDPVASRNTEQATLDYELSDEYDADSPVEVSLNLDSNGIITVGVSVPGTGFFESATVDYHQARSQPAASPGSDGGRGRQEDQLNEAIAFASRFLEDYQDYMTTEQVQQMREYLSRAYEGTGGPRMAALLLNHIYTCDVAFRLLSAERTLAGATPQESRQITEAMAQVRQAWEHNMPDLARTKSKTLNAHVKKSLQRRSKAGDVAAHDFGGLLRLAQGDG